MTDETPRLLAWRERMTARPPCARSPVRWPAILRRSMKRFPIFCAPTSCVRERAGRPSAARATEGRSGVVGVQPRMNASRSALIVSTLDVGMPCGKPAYVFSVLFLASFADRSRNPHTGRSGRRRHASRERGSWCFQVFGEVGLRERDDAVVVGLRAAHHALPPPVPDDALRRLRAVAVIAVERAGGHVVVELRTVRRELPGGCRTRPSAGRPDCCPS